ncbi:MAG TPA: hypothetical protein VMB24_03155, partial [Dehalococcoidales bacterium]|nr:hypothetical protein [Dehalococcoidales bacterium]
AAELQSLFKGCRTLEVAGSNVTMQQHSLVGKEIAADLEAWNIVVELERKLNHDSGLLNSGSHIIMAARKI